MPGFLVLFGASLPRDMCRDWPRHIATGRALSHLFDVRDVSVYRPWIDEVFFTKSSFYAAAIKIAFGAIALDAARCTGKSSPSIALQSLVDCEGEIAVWSCRDWSRHIVAHVYRITRLVPQLAGYPHKSPKRLTDNCNQPPLAN